MKILICDDDSTFLKYLYNHVQEYMNNHFIPCVIETYTDPRIIVDNNTKYDISILDIQMDGIDGILLAKELRKRNEKIALFFITNYDRYIDDSFDLHALRFFQKPIDVIRLYSGLDRAMEYLNDTYLEVFLREENHHARISVDKILYITRENRRVYVITMMHRICINDSFSSLIEQIPNIFFYLVHNSFFVNLHHVTKYKYSELEMRNGDQISVASRKQADFHRFWFDYLRRN